MRLGGGISEVNPSNPSTLQALQFLYNFSVIGFASKGGSEGGTKLIWKYKDVGREFDSRRLLVESASRLYEEFGSRKNALMLKPKLFEQLDITWGKIDSASGKK